MPTPFDQIAGLNKLIHEPARLAIMTALSSCSSADFLFLQRLTGLTKGNLSAHLSRLEREDLVKIDKTFIGKKPYTFVSLTPGGEKQIDRHWTLLEQLRNGAQQWKPDRGEVSRKALRKAAVPRQNEGKE